MSLDFDPYEVLGVSKTAPVDEIKSAYRKLAKKYHPDAGKEEGVFFATRLNPAKEILLNAEKRARYDSESRKNQQEQKEVQSEPEPVNSYDQWLAETRKNYPNKDHTGEIDWEKYRQKSEEGWNKFFSESQQIINEMYPTPETFSKPKEAEMVTPRPPESGSLSFREGESPSVTKPKPPQVTRRSTLGEGYEPGKFKRTTLNEPGGESKG